jgi:hypothetical protein
MSICKSQLTGGGAKFIKVGNDSFLAVEGFNVAQRMLLNDLRIEYKDIFKSQFKLEKETTIQINYTSEPVVFLAIKIKYSTGFKLEEDKFLLWRYQGQMVDNSLGYLLVLTGNIDNSVGVIEIENVNINHDVELEIMLATR